MAQQIDAYLQLLLEWMHLPLAPALRTAGLLLHVCQGFVPAADLLGLAPDPGAVLSVVVPWQAQTNGSGPEPRS